VSLIAESLKRASEEWDPDRYKTVGHILNRPLPLKYSNFRSYQIFRKVVFSSGLLLGAVLMGFLVVGGPSEEGPVQVQVPPVPIEKIPVTAKSPIVKEGAVSASESVLVDRMTSLEEKRDAAKKESAPVAPSRSIVENTSKRDKTVVIKNKPAIKPQKTVRKETVRIEDEFAIEPQKTGQPTQAELTHVSQVVPPPTKEEGGSMKSWEVPSQGKVQVKVEARASVPETKESLEETDLFHDSEYYFNLAVYYQQKKNYLKALELYDQALQLDPANARTYNNQSLIYQELGNTSEGGFTTRSSRRVRNKSWADKMGLRINAT